MSAINPRKIAGRWIEGVALDLHTISSIYVGVNEHGRDMFDTKRSELGELLVRLKYKGDQSALRTGSSQRPERVRSRKRQIRSDRPRDRHPLCGLSSP